MARDGRNINRRRRVYKTMEIILTRHGDALSPDKAEAIGLSDGERPLTEKGKRQTRAAAAALRHVLDNKRVDYLLTSPLLRARQTGDILGGYLGDPVADPTDALAPAAGNEAIDTMLRTCGDSECLLLVGHAPDLGKWVSWGLTRQTCRLRQFKQNGVALIEFPGVAEGGTGTLRWLLTGTQLRDLAPQTSG